MACSFRWLSFIAVGVLLCCFILSPAHSSESRGNLPQDVQRAINTLLAARGKNTAPTAAALAPLLEYAMSPLNHSPGGQELFPTPRSEGQGIFWRAKLQVPLNTLLQYAFNPKMPGEAVYPAAIRYARWLPGSDILTAGDLWAQKVTKDAYLVLRGAEYEEITPDTFSGAYYSYTLDRLLILTEYEGLKALISVNWQRGNSSVGQKAANIGPYENWDFIYSGAKGTLARGIGWAETYMYAASAIAVFYEETPGGATTGYSLFKWLRAGWSGMNMVKRNHIRDGTIRAFTGLQDFMEAPNRPSADAIIAYTQQLRALDVETLRKRFAPYSAKVTEIGKTDAVLQTDDFQKVINNGSYGANLQKEELIAAMTVNFIKQKLGKPQLAGPLE